MQRPSSRQCVYNTGTQRRQTAQSNSNVHGSTTTSQARASMLPSHTSGSSSSQASAAPLPHSFDAEGNIALTAAQTRARDKQREWEGFLKVLRQTEHLQEQLRQLGEKTELLEDGGQGSRTRTRSHRKGRRELGKHVSSDTPGSGRHGSARRQPSRKRARRGSWRSSDPRTTAYFRSLRRPVADRPPRFRLAHPVAPTSAPDPRNQNTLARDSAGSTCMRAQTHWGSAVLCAHTRPRRVPRPRTCWRKTQSRLGRRTAKQGRARRCFRAHTLRRRRAG